ncbi:MAG: Ig-like domain-containing protein [Bacteroidaceae bacterium]|nr:Ig-like domain-containing protein [Bacteroidaceae bacterium]
MKIRLLLSLFFIQTLCASAANLTVRQCLPLDGSKDVDINAAVKIIFTENIALGEGQCLFNGAPVASSVTAVIASLEIPALDYGTTYTVYVPEGVFVSKNDKSKTNEVITFSFTTKARPMPEPRLFDAVVSLDGTGDYNSVQAAVNAAPSNRTKPWLIFVRNGVYNELIRIPEDKPYLHLIGEDRDSTIIQYKICCDFSPAGGYTGHDTERFATAEEWGQYALSFNAGHARNSKGIDVMAHIDAKNFYSESITYNNLWGVDERNYPQALAVQCTKDRTAFYNCRARSYQDTWRTPSAASDRQYVKNCFIEGNVDFIYCNGDVFFDSCHINIVKNHLPTEEAGWIVAPSHDGVKWGYVFNDCYLSAEEANDSIYLGRAWIAQPKTVFLNLQLDDKIYLRPEGWDSHFGNAIPVVFADWHTRNADGTFNDNSKRNNYYWYEGGQGIIEGYARQYISDEEASRYTFDNIIPGTDSWRPDIMTQRLPAPVLKVDGALITWEAVPYAICYEVRRNNRFVGFTLETSYEFSGAASEWQVLAVNEFGARGYLSAGAGTQVASPKAEKPVVVGRDYFDLSGRRVNAGYKGVYIEHRILSDGSVETRRFLNKN